MASLRCDIPPKFFVGMLNGVAKRAVYAESVTNAFLQENLFKESNMTSDAIDALLADAERLVMQATTENWDVARLQAALEEAAIAEEHKEAFLGFWRSQSAKMHACLTNKSVWTDTMKGCSWRVDMVTSSKLSKDVGEPAAILELGLGARGTAAAGGDGAPDSVVRFEMSKDQLASMLAEMSAIGDAIRKRS